MGFDAEFEIWALWTDPNSADYGETLRAATEEVKATFVSEFGKEPRYSDMDYLKYESHGSIGKDEITRILTLIAEKHNVTFAIDYTDQYHDGDCTFYIGSKAEVLTVSDLFRDVVSAANKLRRAIKDDPNVAAQALAGLYITHRNALPAEFANSSNFIAKET